VIRVDTVSQLRTAVATARARGGRIGLVPTMGAFHEGHLALMRRAREECDTVVVSLFVNPAQFGDAGDLAAYPRDELRDAALAKQVGVDILFAPPEREVYPEGFSTTVSVAGITESLEGHHRGREHFEGVATVVAKLFNMAAPDVAYFGQKDAQQVLVIRQLVRDLDIPVQVETVPTVRDEAGLALSSRNARLSSDELDRATALSRALRSIQAAVDDGERDPRRVLLTGLSELSDAGITPEYLELVSPETLEPAASIEGDTLAVLAARVAGIRLIDNQLIRMLAAASETEVATPLRAPTT
jgi:pantoate--beta-alanine ligase